MSKRQLDVKGLKCPLPVLKIQKAMKSLKGGEVLEVLTTDPLAVIDVPAYCNESGNRLLSHQQKDGSDIFEIERG